MIRDPSGFVDTDHQIIQLREAPPPGDTCECDLST
jgi:hypothetical protein